MAQRKNNRKPQLRNINRFNKSAPAPKKKEMDISKMSDDERAKVLTIAIHAAAKGFMQSTQGCKELGDNVGRNMTARIVVGAWGGTNMVASEDPLEKEYGENCILLLSQICDLPAFKKYIEINEKLTAIAIEKAKADKK
jgi:hypothetical protein